jgi:hypothetical protein
VLWADGQERDYNHMHKKLRVLNKCSGKFMQEGLGTRKPVQRHSCRRLPTQDVRQKLRPHHELCTSGLQRARYTVSGPQILSNYPASHHLLSMPNMKEPHSALRRVVVPSSSRMQLQHITHILTVINNTKHTSARDVIQSFS